MNLTFPRIVASILVSSSFSQADPDLLHPISSTPAAARLEIDLSKTRVIDPMLLGLNCSWPEGLYGKIGYENPHAEELIRQFKPVALRFPHGVWANFYDWESDGRRMTDSYKTPYDSAVKDHPELRYGFKAFHLLHEDLDFDVLFTWNVNYDSPEKGVRRLESLREKGFKAGRIELGNEIFWKTQRSEAVSTEEKYIEVAKSHASALKEKDPSIRVSVPVHWREALSNPWNLALKDQNWFDAVTVHKYIQQTPEAKEAGEIFAARLEMLKMADEIQQVFPGKPIWLSEWAIGAQDETSAILGMLDTWLAILEHPEIFALSNYFQMNAEHALINYDKKTGTHTRSGFGAAYEAIRIAFYNSEWIETKIQSQKISGGPNVVSAAAAIREGRITVFAINQSDHPVPLTIDTGKTENCSPKIHRTLRLKNDLSFAMDEKVFQDILPGTSGAMLPSFSINLIEMETVR